MKKLILIPVLAATAVLVAGGCVFKKPAQPSVEGSQKTTSTEEIASSSSTAVAESSDSATSTQEIDMSDWKTYRNEELGFEVKYPSAWKDPETQYYNNGLVLWRRDGDSAGFFVERLIVNNDELKKRYLDQYHDDERVELNGTSGYQDKHRSYAEAGKIAVNKMLLINNDIYYFVEPHENYYGLTKEQFEIWEKMLSTFKVFEPTSVDPNGYSILKDKSLGLEMNIPNTWMVTDRSDEKSSISFASKWRDQVFAIDTINLSVTKGSDIKEVEKKYGELTIENNVFESFDQLNLDAKTNFNIKPSYADYSDEDRPSFWGDCVSILVKEGAGYYEIWYMATGSTKEQVEKYDLELKYFLETLKKSN